jgi:hypothetical protein
MGTPEKKKKEPGYAGERQAAQSEMSWYTYGLPVDRVEQGKCGLDGNDPWARFFATVDRLLKKSPQRDGWPALPATKRRWAGKKTVFLQFPYP